MKKELVSFLLLFLMLFQMVTPALAAASIEEALGDVNIQDGGHSMNYLIAGKGVQNLNYCYYSHTDKKTGTVTEIPAYCVNPNDPGVSQVGDYTVSATEIASDPKIVGIASNSYPHMSLEALNLKDKYEGYYAGKIAIWCYLLPSWDINKIRVNPNCVDQAAAERVLNAAKYAYQQGTTWSQHIKPSFIVVPNSSKAAPDTVDSSFYSQTFTVKSDTWVVDGIVNIKLKPGQKTYGAKIVNADTNAPISQITMKQDGNNFWGKFKVLYPKNEVTGKTGNVQFDLSSTVYKYEVFYGVSYDKAKQDYLVDTDPKYYANAAGTSSFSPGGGTTQTEEQPETGIKIFKYETGTTKPLEGAVFEVIDPDGKTVGTFTSNNQGIVIVPCVKMGNYTIKELTPPKDHLITKDNVVQVDVKYNEITTITMYNDPYGELTIEKIDKETGKGIAGAVFELKNIVSGQTQSVTTEATGRVQISQLTPGAYEVKETYVPEPYILDDKIHTVHVVGGENNSFTVTNQAKPRLKIVKFDKNTNTTLPDTTFEIRKDGELLGEYTTDQLGEINLQVEPGTYYVKEITAPAGYEVDSYPQEIEVKAGQTTTATLIFFNLLKPGMGLVKVDRDTLEPLANAVFSFQEIGGGFYEERTTGIDGRIDLSDLPSASFEVREVKAPDGYLMDDSVRIIKLKAGENAQFVFTDTQEPSLSIVKYDPVKNKPLPGAAFRIAKLEDGSRYLDRITDENGRIHIDNLSPGIYSIQETAAPEGYILNSKEYHVELFAGKESQLVVENQAKPDLLIIKEDGNTGERLAGATFKVKKADGATVTTVTTNNQGEALLEQLETGVYQVQEITAPSGYLLNNEPQMITLVPNKTGVLVFDNYMQPTLTVNKIDSITKDPIPGAKFEVWYASNSTFTGEINKIGVYYTDEKGQFAISGLRDGWYRITEIEPADGYQIKEPATQEVYIKGGTGKTLTFENIPLSGMVIKKVDKDSGKVLQGAKFQVRYFSGVSGTGGTVIGEYTTSRNGTIVLNRLKAGTYIVEETQAPNGYEITEAAKTVYITGQEQAVITLEFADKPVGGLQIVKLDEDSRQPIQGVTFAVRKMDGAYIGSYTTDKNGSIALSDLADGWYVVTETKAAKGYLLDSESHNIEVKNGKGAYLEVTNQKASQILIHKVDSQTGEGIYGVTFLLSDKNHNPIGQYTTDQEGYIYIADGLEEGKFYLREIKAADGYLLDDTVKTVYVRYGATTEIRWENTAEKGQIQVIKKSANDNPINGLPAGSLLEGAVFEIYDKAGNTVDRIVSDKNGRAVSKLLPLSRYTVREVKAAPYYAVNDTTMTAYLEFAGQIVTFEMLNNSVSTGVSITKTGYKEVMSNQPIRYKLDGIKNTSSVALDSFYWRDKLPYDVKLEKIATGTYNQNLNYKIVYKTNLSDYRTLADNLSTQRNYVVDTSAAALGLASNEHITEIMFVFGTVKAGFANVETPYLYGTTRSNLMNGAIFTNVADVGGLYDSQWIMGVSRWVTKVYNKISVTLPKTGY